uniref:G_PROTEIN_RECEP_F1_2 domain-containing protein n=1 Tax=Steinernema glaseri TaxID=37863 RepID=A0A1I8A8J5_9BILA
MLVNARIPTSVTQKAKSGNVLALLDTFYLSGFATYVSPSNPMLKGRTQHTLYAFSFLIYSMNCFCDWIHVYCLLRGYVTTFPLKTGLVIALVTTVVCGSMLTALLLVLCVENAFISRMRISPYQR